MKKVMLVILFALLAVGMMAAQGFVPKTDVLGAHNNGGRGCAACHAPHSGGRGSGGQTVAGSGVTPVPGLNEGDYHLWGTDMSLITQETLYFGGGYDNGGKGYVLNFGGGQEWTATTAPYIGLIASCLSCHDGNVSEGAMMQGQSYEQLAGLLPSGAGEYAHEPAVWHSQNSNAAGQRRRNRRRLPERSPGGTERERQRTELSAAAGQLRSDLHGEREQRFLAHHLDVHRPVCGVRGQLRCTGHQFAAG